MQGPLPLELLSSNYSTQPYRSFIGAIKKGKKRKEKLSFLQWGAKKTDLGSNIAGNHLPTKHPVACAHGLIFLPSPTFTNAMHMIV